MLQKQLSFYFSCDKYTFSRKSHNTDVRRKLNFLISLFFTKNIIVFGLLKSLIVVKKNFFLFFRIKVKKKTYLICYQTVIGC